MEVLFALLAAAFNALGSVLQRRGAARAPSADSLRLRLVVDLLRQPVWAGGIAAMILGVLLQALALHEGALALVAPVIVIELPFTLLLAALILRRRVDKRTIGAILVTTAALSALLLIARPSSGQPSGVPAFAWILAIAGTVGVVTALVLAGRRFSGSRRAALLATAAGVGHGLSATLMKSTTFVASQGVAAVFGSWKLYGMIVAGGLSLYLFQNALQAGSVVAAQPGVTIADPLVSILFGLVLFGEHVQAGVLVVPEALCAATVAAGIVVLARSPLLHDGSGDTIGDVVNGASRPRSAKSPSGGSGDRSDDRPESRSAGTAGVSLSK